MSDAVGGNVKPRRNKLKFAPKICRAWLTPALAVLGLHGGLWAEAAEPARRIVLLKIDGLNADLLNSAMDKTDPATGHSSMPWFSKIFRENGTVFANFYTRGTSLSAPSWSMLDTGHHSVIRGNVEYDRYTGRIYDYLNFFPFYINYARSKQVDMPGVEVLDRAGIPLVIDAFPYNEQFQSFQLLQRGVRWETLKQVLKRRVKSQLFLAPVESVGPTSLDELLGQQTEQEMNDKLENPQVVYLDFYTGDVDHEGHATNQTAAIGDTLRHLDALAGRIWSSIAKSEEAERTIFIAVSDHGMNNRPDRTSQALNLPDFFNGPAGGSHHVITNRHQLSDYKLMGLDPMVQRVVTPSKTSNYLPREASTYPTAWLDLDGNERAAVQLRNSDINKLHMLMQQLERKDLDERRRAAAAAYARELIERHRVHWASVSAELAEEIEALKGAITQRKDEVGEIPRRWTTEQHDKGEDKQARRMARDLTWWERESAGYAGYVQSLRKLLDFRPAADGRFRGEIGDYIPPRQLGERNSIYDLQHYAAGRSASGIALTNEGRLDEAATFQTIDYFPVLLAQHVRNNPQRNLPELPIDFLATKLDDGSFKKLVPEARHAYWLYGGEENQLIVMTDAKSNIATRAVRGLKALESGQLMWHDGAFGPNTPLRLATDPRLKLPPDATPREWLTQWHTEREWLDATHECHYSNGVIGVVELLSPVGENVPGTKDLSPVLLRYERRRRELVQADFHVFAADGWNFNARNFNPGGNHGGFFRISTHSVWMMAGDGIPAAQVIDQPYDSLDFASTILSLAGKAAPMPEKVVSVRK